MTTNQSDRSTLEAKIDLLIDGREKEQILSRMDGLFNVLITISTFIVGIIITQRSFIATNIFISFPLTCVIFTLISSFIIGTIKGIFGKSMDYRILSYCLLLTLPLWYIAIPITLLFAPPRVSSFQYQGIIILTLIFLIVFSVIVSRLFVRWFRQEFKIIFEPNYQVSNKIYYWLIVVTLMIIALAIVASVIMFIVWGLPTLLK
jgi:hypothetical protein